MLSSLFAVFKGLLQQHPEKNRLLTFLSSDVKEKIEQASFPPIAINEQYFSTKHLTEDVHYSWIIPFFKSQPKHLQEFFLSAFSEKISLKLQAFFHLSPPPPPKKIVLAFLQTYLFSQIFPETSSLLPQKYLPDASLNVLLAVSKKDLIKMIDFLALYDIAVEMPKIVNTTILKKIDQFLSQEKKEFLQSILSYKEPFSFPSLALHHAATKKEFFFLLHKRGLHRFSQAICVQDKDLIWYICHKLDIGRGKTLLKLCKEKEMFSFAVAEIVTANILQLLPIITQK